ncbi:tRNA lysidine(34) synthetase TilS [Bifidobacterium thermophilum]|uniref:tRNA lysidine(34) synthetase TilS n=1 Tax=Bifidobacterium thermophilum TaxID=33905 RepID=UPI0030A2D80A
MAYTAGLRAAIGQVRASLEDAGLGLRDRRFTRHGTHTPLPDAPLVLVACSGGRDSMALAAVAHIVCGMLGLRCGAIVVDHRVQAGSTEAALDAAARCSLLGLDPVSVRFVHVEPDGKGQEAAARDARYEALVDEAKACGAQAILLAHTCDDQAETIIMGLLRSGGVDALCGMPRAGRRDGVTLLRPFLGLTRAQTTGICRDLAITWWDDPTNGDGIAPGERLSRDYPLRSRIRHDLMPVLEDIAGGDIARHLARYAEGAASDREYLDGQAAAVYRTSVQIAATAVPGVWLDARALAVQPAAIRRRVIARACASLDVPVSARHVEAIEQLIVDWHGQQAVNLPSGYQAFRQKHVIRVCQDSGHENR